MTTPCACGAPAIAVRPGSEAPPELIPRGNPRSSGYDRHTDDWYVEPARAICALLDVETFSGAIWDPACGGGNIPEACKARGYQTFATDLVDRGYGEGGVDFLATDWQNAPPNVVSNPPFGIAVQFVRRALTFATGKVCVLQRTTWLEGERRYQELFARGTLARLWQFRSRISMPPGDAAVKAQGGAVAFAWYVFQRDHRGAPTIGWLP
jgi:hypothetical protein